MERVQVSVHKSDKSVAPAGWVWLFIVLGLIGVCLYVALVLGVMK